MGSLNGTLFVVGDQTAAANVWVNFDGFPVNSAWFGLGINDL